jgi:aspartate racemase
LLSEVNGTVKHIGIVAVSAEGAALCYRTICLEGAALLGPHDHPEISLHGFSLRSYQHLIDQDRWDAVGEMMLESAARLVRAGAQLLICPDNTVHQGLDLVRERSPAPWIHIAEEVSNEARQRGFKRIAILGTRFLMEGPVYQSKLAPACIGYRVPNTEQRTRINQIIYDELVYGRFLPASRTYFQNVIRELGDNGCDAVALACTEIPLLISEADSSLPILDSTRIHARAALREATSAEDAKSAGTHRV